MGTCLELQAQGVRFSPAESATKFAWLLEQAGPAARDTARLGTVDTWLAWQLSQGALHITDASNATVTGLYRTDGTGWRQDAIEQLRLPGRRPSYRGRLVRASGEATALPGHPPLCALIGDQQASLMGQGCTRPGLAKATFGTGAMLTYALARPGRHSPSGATAAASRSSPGSVTVS